MKKIGFFTLGEKAYRALLTFISDVGAEYIGHVKIAVDNNISTDFSKDIENLCIQNSISYSYRNEINKGNNNTETDLDFAIGWRWMLPKKNLVVLHDSLLPKYRGFSPLVNMLINGEEFIGVTALFASDEYDTGDILAQESIKIKYPIKVADAITIISGLYAKVLVKVAKQFIASECLLATPQDESKATYSLWRDDEDYFVNWNQCAATIERAINALGEPFSGAKTVVNNKILYLSEAEAVADVVIENRHNNIGKVIFFSDGCPVIVCGSGLLKVSSMYTDRKKKFNATINFRTKFKNFGYNNDII